MQPLCFVLMPFGRRPTASGISIDFDAVYSMLIAPSIREAGMETLRADQEIDGGIVHKSMFERLILCDFAVADITTANANVFYELGVRHAARPASTLILFANGLGPLPFDVAMLRAVPYVLAPDGTPLATPETISEIAKRLRAGRAQIPDSPIYQLVEGFPDIQRLKTDVFRDRALYREEVRTRLAAARKGGLGEVKAIEADLNVLADQETGVIIDLLLSFRAVKAWQEMIALVNKMAAPLARSVLVQEQLAFALNRNGQGEQAESVLLEVLRTHGPSSETYGLLGRVYKDRWEAAAKANNPLLAQGLLAKAIDAYLKGFEADWRDAYPGVNAVTLMELKEPPDERRKALFPVVSYAVARRIAQGQPDYWDWATMVELAVMSKQETQAKEALAHALAAKREPWEPETTARNIGLILAAWERRKESLPWAKEVTEALILASAR